MRALLKLCIAVMALSIIGDLALAQSEVTVGKIDFPNREWGKQSLEFDVTNTSDWLRFLVVEADVHFEDSYSEARRAQKSFFPLEPNKTLTVKPSIEIPGNFGKAELMIRVYDVIDTLDDLSLGHKILEQPFRLTFHVPEEILPYRQEKITLPPLCENHQQLDNEFSRMLLVFLLEKKTVAEIAAIGHIDSAAVTHMLGELQSAHLIRRVGDTYTPAIPVITTRFAEEAMPMIEAQAGRFAEIVAGNLPGYGGTLDSLIAAGVVNADSNMFASGNTLLHRRYPTVTGLLMWYRLGNKFIISNGALQIFGSSNPCRPNLGSFMYVIHGGDFFNGQNYYRTQGNILSYADHLPAFICVPESAAKSYLREGADWMYADEDKPEAFFVDAGALVPALDALAGGTDEFLTEVEKDAFVLAQKHGHTTFDYGLRYWYWNLLVTKTINKLVADGVLTRRGNGNFRFQVNTK
ncbi:MAG: hypothetical protein KKA42_01860 [candidate division Zixibacteria bacterium]|nr:hypothetical protein [candidate division Zixibacteria bacterium]